MSEEEKDIEFKAWCELFVASISGGNAASTARSIANNGMELVKEKSKEIFDK